MTDVQLGTAPIRGKEDDGVPPVRIVKDNGMVTSEGTIYPLLSRLRPDGLVETNWKESTSGPPRRCYRLTAAGNEALGWFTGEWIRFRSGVDYVLERGSK